MTKEMPKVTGADLGRWLRALIIATLVGGVTSNYTGVNIQPHSGLPSLWCSLAESALTGYVYDTTVTETHKLCWDACKVQPFCVSSNYAASSGKCELNNSTHLDNPDGLAQRRGSVYTYSQTQCVGRNNIQSVQIGRNSTASPANLGWPLGRYGLPMPTAGCPTAAGFTWETGYRFHDTENGLDGPSNDWSDFLHLIGPYAENDMSQNFCMKAVGRVSEDDVTWPLGKYCIFMFGEDCPINMDDGYIYWDDQDTNNENKAGGTLPSGEYDDNTRIDYCCMTAGNVSRPIALPTGSAFYLFAFTEQCQEVRAMSVSQEWFMWDDEDVFNQDGVKGSHPYDTGKINHVIHYCYYEPYYEPYYEEI